MRIGEAARQAGVGVETVRFYELKGLIDQPAKPDGGGFREYSGQDVRRVLFVRSAQQLGFSLGEIADLLELETGPDAQCVEVRKRASVKLEEVNGKIENLNRIRYALEVLIEACPGAGPARDCSILETINNGELLLESVGEGDVNG